MPPRGPWAWSTGVADWVPSSGEASLSGEQVPTSPWAARRPLSPTGLSPAEKVRQLSELVPSEGLATEEEMTMPAGGARCS